MKVNLMETKLLPKYKQAWLEALRSGKYMQGWGSLRQSCCDGNVKHCCLGVLCDITYKQAHVRRNLDTNRCFGGNEGFPPEKITKLVLENINPEWTYEDGDEGIDVWNELVELNDIKGYTFEQIADWIEQNL